MPLAVVPNLPGWSKGGTNLPAPSKWTLAGGGISVHYTTTPTPGVLHYVDVVGPKTFSGAQIRVVPERDLGTLVSVTLNVSPVAETTFTVLLPAAVLDAAHPVEPVQTDGFTTHHLLFPPLGQKAFYTVTPLVGSASL
jgi:hypothetical protein